MMMETLDDSLDKDKKLFPQKLWDLINDDRYRYCLRWSDDGERVYLNRDEFEEQYLKTSLNQFHTQKAISFVRQMNMYGFRKVDDYHYENENFKRDYQHLLKKMIRRHPIKNSTSPPLNNINTSHLNSTINTSNNSHHQSSLIVAPSIVQFQQQQQSRNHTNLNNGILGGPKQLKRQYQQYLNGNGHFLLQNQNDELIVNNDDESSPQDLSANNNSNTQYQLSFANNDTHTKSSTNGKNNFSKIFKHSNGVNNNNNNNNNSNKIPAELNSIVHSENLNLTRRQQQQNNRARSLVGDDGLVRTHVQDFQDQKRVQNNSSDLVIGADAQNQLYNIGHLSSLINSNQFNSNLNGNKLFEQLLQQSSSTSISPSLFACLSGGTLDVATLAAQLNLGQFSHHLNKTRSNHLNDVSPSNSNLDVNDHDDQNSNDLDVDDDDDNIPMSSGNTLHMPNRNFDIDQNLNKTRTTSSDQMNGFEHPSSSLSSSPSVSPPSNHLDQFLASSHHNQTNFSNNNNIQISGSSSSQLCGSINQNGKIPSNSQNPRTTTTSQSSISVSTQFVRDICDQRNVYLDDQATIEAERLTEKFLSALIDDAKMIVEHRGIGPDGQQQQRSDGNVSSQCRPHVDASSLLLALKLMTLRLLGALGN